MNKKVLLTGGTGFIGANLAKRLIQDGHQVNLIIKPEHNLWRLQEHKSNYQFHVSDLSNTELLKDLLTKIKPDWIFHLAANGAYSWQNDLQNIIKTNINGSVNLLQCALEGGFEAFINAGSSSEYGLKDHPPNESEALNPNSYYAVSKAFFSMFCSHTSQSTNHKIVTLRLYSAYGPYEEPKRLIPTLAVKGFNNSLPALVNKDTARDFIYIDDVCDAFILAAQNILPRGAIYNIGSGKQTTIEEAVRVVSEILKITALPSWGDYPARTWDTNSWVAEISRAKNELDWHPKVSFFDGLNRYIEWFQEDESRLRFYREHLAG